MVLPPSSVSHSNHPRVVLWGGYAAKCMTREEMMVMYTEVLKSHPDAKDDFQYPYKRAIYLFEGGVFRNMTKVSVC